MAAVEAEVLRRDHGGLLPSVPTAESGRSPLELFAAAIAFLIPIAYSAGLEAETWSARAAILLVVAAVGVPVLVSQAREKNALAARAAIAFLLIGCASAVASHNHTVAVFGLYDQASGLLFMAGLAAAWAIGRSIRPEARSLVERALIVGVLANVGIALLASVLDLSALGATLVDNTGRSAALAGNPVHLGSLAVLGLALFVPRFAAAPAKWAIAVIAVAAAAQLSGTRLALVVMVGVVAWAGRRYGVRIAAAFGLCVILGLAAGSALVPSGSASATARAGGIQTAESWRDRPEVWLSARHALAQRPLLGVGPGQFRTATSPYRSTSIALSEGADRLFTDAHNIFVEYATTTGVIGIAALMVWLAAASQRARGCLLAGAIAVLAIHLFEPQSMVTTPLAFLALGASTSTGLPRPRPARHGAHWIFPTCCTAVAISAAALFLLGQFDLRQGQLDLRLAPARQANSVLPAWPRTASLLAQVWLFYGIASHSDAGYHQSRSWLVVAVGRDDTDPALWNALAELDDSQGLTSEAEAEYKSALHFNPTSARAMRGLARVANSQCDLAGQTYWTQRSLQVSPPPGPSALNGPGGPAAPAPVCAGR